MTKLLKPVSFIILFVFLFQNFGSIETFALSGNNMIEVTFDTNISGAITPENTSTTYKITPPIDGKYIMFTSGDTNTVASLYDSFGNLIKESNNAANNTNFRIDASLLADNVYFLEVKHAVEGKLGRYTLRVSKPASNIPKGLLLFTGYYDKGATHKYPTYTDSDISQILDNKEGLNIKEFVITTASHRYNTYNDGFKTKQIVTLDEIKNLDKSLTAEKSDRLFGLMKEQYSIILTGNYLSGERYNGENLVTSKKSISNLNRQTAYRENYNSEINAGSFFMNEGYHDNSLETAVEMTIAPENIGPISEYLSLDSFVTDATDLAKKLIKEDPNVKIWFALPGICFPSLAENYIEPYKKNVVDGVRQNMTTEQWNNNIEGFYFATEGIPVWYTNFDPHHPESFGNPIVKTMKEVSTYVHSQNKKFMWIPYYGPHYEGYNTNDDFKVGYIANKTAIFDYVIVQPNYYFSEKQENNLYTIRDSVEENMIKDHTGEIVGEYKFSSTIIGAEMEIDERVVNNPFYKKRYKDYVEVYDTYKESRPVMYYAGDRNQIMYPEIFKEIRDFFDY